MLPDHQGTKFLFKQLFSTNLFAVNEAIVNINVNN